MLKNVSLIRRTLNGKETWGLLNSNGRPLRAFDIFAKTLERHSINTRANYCRWLAEFIDYLFEASEYSLPSKGAFQYEALIEVIESYDDYLVFGTGSGKQIARQVANSLPSPRISHRSATTKHAAIRHFLKLSERIRLQMLELTKNGVLLDNVDEQNLFVDINAKRNLTQFQQRALKANSMLAGVIAGGPRLIQRGILPIATPDISYEHNRAFPFDKVIEVLDNLTSYRDKALYAFCAASGCRISEALQLLWDDIDVKSQRVRLVDPKSRPNCRSYLGLTPEERDRLVWKGRSTQLTLLIDPFSTKFFESLSIYLRHEYIPHGRHSFVFQYTKDDVPGMPYFLASASSRNGVLKRVFKLANVEDVGGPHSFRHMYGTYLFNYFPRPNGTYGLPLGLVQKIMGHRLTKDTEKYARFDKDLIEAELKIANEMLFGNGKTRSINEIIRESLLSRLEAVEAELSIERSLK